MYGYDPEPDFRRWQALHEKRAEAMQTLFSEREIPLDWNFDEDYDIFHLELQAQMEGYAFVAYVSDDGTRYEMEQLSPEEHIAFLYNELKDCQAQLEAFLNA